MTLKARVVPLSLAVLGPVATSLLFGSDIRWLVAPASVMFLLIVALSFVGGGSAGFVAAVSSTLSLWFVCIPPAYSFALPTRDDAVATAAIAAVSLVLAAMVSWLRARERHAIEQTGVLQKVHDADSETILALQQAVLPTGMPHVDGVRLAASYYAGGEHDSPVGGDWFAYLPLDDHRVGIAVGDVVGHGIEAVAAMAEFRYTFRALAADGVAPDVALDRFEELNARLGRVDVFTTCLYAVLDQQAATLTLASAGHPPPLLLRDHTVRPLEGRYGPPIGLVPSRGAYQATTFGVYADDVLVFYTDGLVERPGESIDHGMARLGNAVARLLEDRDVGGLSSADLNPLIVELVGAAPRDDSLLVLAHVTAGDPALAG